MKPSTILASLGSFAAGAVLALAASEALARPARAAAPSSYSNAVYGFSILAPAFPKAEKDTGVQSAMFFAPAKNGFSSNLGIGVQAVKMTLDEYVALSLGQFKQANFKVVSEDRKKVSGKDAVLWEYEGSTQGRELKWMALAVADVDRVFLVTGTALKGDYDTVAKEFKASIESFKLTE